MKNLTDILDKNNLKERAFGLAATRTKEALRKLMEEVSINIEVPAPVRTAAYREEYYVAGGALVRTLVGNYRVITNETAYSAVSKSFADLDLYQAPWCFSQAQQSSHKKTLEFDGKSSKNFAVTHNLKKPIESDFVRIDKIQLVKPEVMPSIANIQDALEHFDIDICKSFYYNGVLYVSDSTIDGIINKRLVHSPKTSEHRLNKYKSILGI